MPEIDWSKAEVFPKIDGSLIKIYNYRGTWYCSTRGMVLKTLLKLKETIWRISEHIA